MSGGSTSVSQVVLRRSSGQGRVNRGDARLPKNWPSQVKAAVLQVISLV